MGNTSGLPAWVVAVTAIAALAAAIGTTAGIHNSACCAGSILDPQPNAESPGPFYYLIVVAFWLVYNMTLLVLAALVHNRHQETFE